MDIAIGCDHAGYTLKTVLVNFLTVNGMNVEDCGCKASSPCDYPDYGKKVAEYVNEDPENRIGILICGTGIGMSIVANRYPNVRAALCNSSYDAKMARKHNNANIICLGSRTTTVELARDFVEMFLYNDFEGGRHKRRVDKI